jgi:hypothetical protein
MILNSNVELGNVDKNLIIIRYLKDLFPEYLIKSEISTNDEDTKVIVVQMATGNREILYDGYIYDNFTIEIFGTSIRENKQTAYEIGLLPGNNIQYEYNGDKYQILFKQMSNPTNIMYQDIRRIGYTLTLQTIINKMKGESK